MKTAIRGLLKVGLLVAGAAGVVYLGSGIASAQPTPAGHLVAQPVRQHQPVAHPQYLVKRDPIGMLVDGVVRRVQELASPGQVHPMGSADRP
jgi:hypothetical protein